jgi:hypothetical protein
MRKHFTEILIFQSALNIVAETSVFGKMAGL